MKEEIIVLDADGVILDYRASYPIVWKKAFGTELALARPESYHAHVMYGIDFSLDPVLEKQFFANFTSEIWANLPPCEGAIQACQNLADAGYTLVCVSSMPAEFVDERKCNFAKLGMPISEVIATGRIDAQNPKLEVVNKINPVAFVDDLGSNFSGINSTIHRALIHGGHHDNPNDAYRHLASSIHTDLNGFARKWLGERVGC